VFCKTGEVFDAPAFCKLEAFVALEFGIMEVKELDEDTVVNWSGLAVVGIDFKAFNMMEFISCDEFDTTEKLTRSNSEID
jgi:hypothetical protein